MSVCLLDKHRPLCGHCVLPIRGYGSLNGVKLCHPDHGLDCLRLVSVHGHDMPCRRAVCVASVRSRMRRESGETDR